MVQHMLDKPSTTNTRVQNCNFTIWIMQLQKHQAEANHSSASSLKFWWVEKAMMPTRGGGVVKKLAHREMFWMYTLNTLTAN